MDSLESKVAIVTGGSSGAGVVAARPNTKKTVGLLLCLGAVVVVAGGWAWARSSGAASTDNAYVRGDVTSLAPKVAGYV
ncbi:multidrug transporter, partial [Sinorhizobium fredii]